MQVTEIYKGLSGGQSFFLSATDRVLFPTKAIGFQVPYKHLIVDLSIIESEEDDIKEMQKISQAILPLAASAYGLYSAGAIGGALSSSASVALRKEVANYLNHYWPPIKMTDSSVKASFILLEVWPIFLMKMIFFNFQKLMKVLVNLVHGSISFILEFLKISLSLLLLFKFIDPFRN